MHKSGKPTCALRLNVMPCAGGASGTRNTRKFLPCGKTFLPRASLAMKISSVIAWSHWCGICFVLYANKLRAEDCQYDFNDIECDSGLFSSASDCETDTDTG